MATIMVMDANQMLLFEVLFRPKVYQHHPLKKADIVKVSKDLGRKP